MSKRIIKHPSTFMASSQRPTFDSIISDLSRVEMAIMSIINSRGQGEVGRQYKTELRNHFDEILHILSMVSTSVTSSTEVTASSEPLADDVGTLEVVIGFANDEDNKDWIRDTAISEISELIGYQPNSVKSINTRFKKQWILTFNSASGYDYYTIENAIQQNQFLSEHLAELDFK